MDVAKKALEGLANWFDQQEQNAKDMLEHAQEAENEQWIRSCYNEADNAKRSARWVRVAIQHYPIPLDEVMERSLEATREEMDYRIKTGRE